MQPKDIFLNPGELIFATTPHRVKTILGSCVAVAIFDRVKKLGGICHYLLPESEKNDSVKYGNVAIHLLLNKFYKIKSQKKDLVANVVGGSLILENQNEIFFIGDRNVDLAFKILREKNINICFEETGGDKGRTVTFNTYTGDIHVKVHNKFNIKNILNNIRNNANDGFGNVR